MRYKLTSEKLREILEYFPDTGEWVWKISSGAATAGKRAGCINPNGYRVIRINGYGYEAQLLAWIYMTGSWPPDGLHVDHKDTDVSNNKWGNFRLSTIAQNQWNAGLQKNNTSGVKGVTYVKTLGLWKSRVSVNGKRYFLGYFKNLDSAKEYTENFRNHAHKEFANHG